MPVEPGVGFLQTNVVPKISVFGVGGAGVNAVNLMILSQLDGVKFVAANTDCQSLMESLAETKIQLGAKCTKGLGAGSNPEIGKQAGEEASDLIKRELTDTDMLFIATGMGGGTGTGASPIVAKIAKDMGVLVVGIAVKPLKFEGSTRMEVANKGVEELEKYVDTLIVIENEKLRTLNSVSILENYGIANDILRQAVCCVVSVLNKQGFINRDFADIRTVLQNAGRAVIGYGEDVDAKIATDIAIHNPILEETSICGARNVLLNITGNKNLKTTDIEDIVEKVRDEAKSFDNKEPNVIFGIAFDEDIGNNIRVSVIASGVKKLKNQHYDDMSIEANAQKALTGAEQSNNPREEIHSTENPSFASQIDEDDIENEDEFNLYTDDIPVVDSENTDFNTSFSSYKEKKKIANEQAIQNDKRKKNISSMEEGQSNLFTRSKETSTKKTLIEKIISVVSPVPIANELDNINYNANNEVIDINEVDYTRKKASNE